MTTSSRRREIVGAAGRQLILLGHQRLADDLFSLLDEIAPDCPGCREVHESYPQQMSFHSPVCRLRDECAMCHGPLGFSGSLLLGAICAACYGVDPEVREES